MVASQDVTSNANVEPASSALLSDHEFERLKADVFSVTPISMNSNTRQVQGKCLW